MKPKAWEGNSNSFSVTYHINHDGPNYFVTHYKGSCRGHLDPKEAWRVHGVPKFTESAPVSYTHLTLPTILLV